MSAIQFTYLLRFLFFGGLVWLVFFNLSANPSVDAVAYAQGVATGEDLLYPHHLLHSLVGRGLWLPLLQALTHAPAPVEQVSAYTWLALSNGIAYLLLVFGLNRMLVGPGQALHPAILPAAAAWGLLRFSVEFEAYLWPLVFCLAALYLAHQRRWAGSGLCFALALLYHQISLFWLPAILVPLLQTRSLKPWVQWALPLLLVPVGYMAVVWGFSIPTPLTWFLGEFAAGGVKHDFTIRHLLLIPVSAVRSWVQIHGNQLILLRQYPNMSTLLGVAGALTAALYILIGWIGSGRRPTPAAASSDSLYTTAARWATLGLLLGSVLSQGNAEFLAGLPLTVALGWSDLFERRRILTVGSAGLLMGWNLAFGLLPQREYTLYPWEAEATLVTTPGPALATYHKLEVDTWAGRLARRPVLHAQHLTSSAGRFYYFGKPLPDTLLILEQMPAPAYSRATLLETQTGKPPSTTGRTVAEIHHFSGPTRLLELRPDKP